VWARMSLIRSCWSESGWTRMPKAMSAVSPIGVAPVVGLHSPRWLMTIWEMKHGSAWTSERTSPRLWLAVDELLEAELDAALAPPKKSVSESAGQICARAQLGEADKNPWRARTLCWKPSAQEITCGLVGSGALMVTL